MHTWAEEETSVQEEEEEEDEDVRWQGVYGRPSLLGKLLQTQPTGKKDCSSKGTFKVRRYDWYYLTSLDRTKEFGGRTDPITCDFQIMLFLEVKV